MTKSASLTRPSPRRDLFLAVGLPAVLAWLLFARTLSNEFVYDDIWKLGELSGPAPPLVQMLANGRGVAHMMHWLDRYLWEDWLPGFHLTNIFLHAVATGLVAWTCFALTRSQRASLITGLLFAVLPVHVEAVASFANRKDILAMIFIALTVIAWRPGRSPRLRYAIAMACCILAFLSKEIAAVALPIMLLLADLLPLPSNPITMRERLGRAAMRSLPSFAVSLIGSVFFAGNLTLLLTRDSILQRTELRLSNYGQVLANAAASWLEALRLLFFPLRLSADYPLQPMLELTSYRALLGIALVLFWIIITVLLLYRAPIFGFAMAWVLLMFAPLSNLVPLTPFLIAERYLYVPSFGICLLLGLVMDRGLAVAQERYPPWGKAAFASLSALLIITGGVRSFWRIGDWHDERALWSSAIREGIESWRIDLSMGNVLWKEGNLQEAVGYFQRALDSGTLPMSVRRRLVANLWSCGGTREVVRECQRILRDDLREWECHILLGEIARREGEIGKAIEQYRLVLARDAENSTALRELAFTLATSRDPELLDLPLALDLATRALKTSQGMDPEVMNVLAIVKSEAGDLGSAIFWARKGLDLANRQGNLEEATRIQRNLQGLYYRAYRERRLRPHSPTLSD